MVWGKPARAARRALVKVYSQVFEHSRVVGGCEALNGAAGCMDGLTSGAVGVPETNIRSLGGDMVEEQKGDDYRGESRDEDRYAGEP